MDDVEKCAQAIHFVQLAGESCSQIEAEAVHVHLQNPIAQAVHDELKHPWMPHIQGVTRAGIVAVIASIVRHQAVINGIVDSAKG